MLWQRAKSCTRNRTQDGKDKKYLVEVQNEPLCLKYCSESLADICAMTYHAQMYRNVDTRYVCLFKSRNQILQRRNTCSAAPAYTRERVPNIPMQTLHVYFALEK